MVENGDGGKMKSQQFGSKTIHKIHENDEFHSPVTTWIHKASKFNDEREKVRKRIHHL